MELSERIRNYLDKMPVAVSGQGGSNACLTVACVLVWGWGLSLEEAMPFMRDYSQRCSPPWTEKELMHKLRSAEKKPSDKGRGYLLQGRESVKGAAFKPRQMRPVREFVREEWAKINEKAVADFTGGRVCQVRQEQAVKVLTEEQAHNLILMAEAAEALVDQVTMLGQVEMHLKVDQDCNL